LAGGLAGVMLAPAVIRGLLAFLPQNIAAVDLRAAIDPRVFAFALGAVATAGGRIGAAAQDEHAHQYTFPLRVQGAKLIDSVR
jgi:hypothetical protein